jgi:hypothetical protein
MIAAINVRLAMMLGILTILAGCTSDPVFLRHPQTGKKAQCGPYNATGVANRMATVELERGCVADYHRQGYERVME